MQKNIYHLIKIRLELEKILNDQNTDEELKKMAEIELSDLKSAIRQK